MRWAPCLLLLVSWAVLLPVHGRAWADEAPGEERDLEPLPREVVFADPRAGNLDLETDREIREVIQRTSASLGEVAHGRDLLVLRFGLVSLPALVDVLFENHNVTEVANTALTVGALRDVNGTCLELKRAIRPVLGVLQGRGDEAWRAMSTLALGCYHWPETIPPPDDARRRGDYAAVPGVPRAYLRSADELVRARRAIVQMLGADRAFPRVCANLALAKMGGRETREMFLAARHDDGAFVEPRRAGLLASAFLVVGEPKTYLAALRNQDRRIRSSGALAVSVALLQDEPADWTRRPATWLPALHLVNSLYHGEDGAEAWFARGMCAWVNQEDDEWRALWETAQGASTEAAVAAACAEALVHCRSPWFEKALREALTPKQTQKEPVLALVLLRAGERADPEAIRVLGEWLRNRARRPSVNARWDPRWYAVTGLLRALHAGRIRAPEARQAVIASLQRAADTTLEKAPALRQRLRTILAAHAAKILAARPNAPYLLPRAEVESFESGFHDPYGVLARDPVDACVMRVNAMAFRVLGLDSIVPWKSGQDNSKQQQQRYLKRYVERYPYFSRLEFRADRGARPRPALPKGVKGIDR
jgi:hypothetical protein